MKNLVSALLAQLVLSPIGNQVDYSVVIINTAIFCGCLPAFVRPANNSLDSFRVARSGNPFTEHLPPNRRETAADKCWQRMPHCQLTLGSGPSPDAFAVVQGIDSHSESAKRSLAPAILCAQAFSADE
jgi:hypothetical protein